MDFGIWSPICYMIAALIGIATLRASYFAGNSPWKYGRSSPFPGQFIYLVSQFGCVPAAAAWVFAGDYGALIPIQVGVVYGVLLALLSELIEERAAHNKRIASGRSL